LALNAGVSRTPGSQTPKTNVLAVVSLILGVVWIWWVTSILASVFALIALWQIKQRNQKGREMATVGRRFGMMWMLPLGYFFDHSGSVSQNSKQERRSSES
jgi:hypothetical protein